MRGLLINRDRYVSQKQQKRKKLKKNNGPIEFHALGHVSVVSATISDFPLVLTNLAIL